MYIGLHNHTDHSNYRMLDSMNRVEELINYTRQLGHIGVAITDHETVGNHVAALHYMDKLKKDNPDIWKNYKLVLGNEIYLCDREKIQDLKIYEFPHFILLAKNEKGHKAIRELSTRAWCENSFTYVNLRVPTFFDDLEEVMSQYKGDVVASTACIGGELPRIILSEYNEIDKELGNFSKAKEWIAKMVNIFGRENFFLELQPSIQDDQEIVNKVLIKLSKELDIKYIITTDSHYLKKEDRKVHEAFLNSQEADREVGDFYATTYVMSEEEIHQYLDSSLGKDAVQLGLDNTKIIYDMVEEYTLDKPLNIPYVPDDISEPNENLYNKYVKSIPLLEYFYNSNYDSDRHLVREIVNKIEEKPEEFANNETYNAIQTCLESIKLSSEKQNTPWSAYLLQTKELIKVCWDSGSLVGPSRGSGCGFILLYILGITQVNPLREEVETFHWRFLNPERVSPLDIDVDVQGPLRDVIVENLQKKYGGYRHVTKVQTILKAKSKNSIQIACRGLGYAPEDGVYLGSFIKAERGIQHTLYQTYYGDEENNIYPDKEFVSLMSGKYSDVWEISQRIEGLCVGTGQHAGGVILCKEDLVDNVALMKTKSGDVTTQFDLHASEDCSLIKWDLLGVDCLEKIHTEIDLLLEDGYMEWQGDLKSTYEKYLDVYKIDRHNQNIWDLICNHKVISLFQFEKQTGWDCIEKGQPRNLEDMSALNSIMRLMPPDPNSETPLERYSRFKGDIAQWYKEMDDYGLTKDEQKLVAQYAGKNFGLLANQEDFMEIVQDERVGGFNLLWADRLRKSIAKKNPKEYFDLQEEYYANMREKSLSEKLCHYIWDILISMNRGYGFNKSHTLGYSIVALQEANLAYNYPIIYWNAANLISDSGGQSGTVNYDKIATAIGRLKKENIDISLPDINRARFDFRPYVDTNEIIYGLKPISGVGSTIANTIVENQPYSSVEDFYNKMQNYKESSKDAKFGDTAMIQLIKAGCFDKLENKKREEIMEDFIRKISKPLSSLKMQDIEELQKLGLLSENELKTEWRYYKYRKYIYGCNQIARKDGKGVSTWFYTLDKKYAEPFFFEHFESDLTVGKDYIYNSDGSIAVKRGSFEKIFDKKMANFKASTLSNPKNLQAVNESRFKAIWEEKAEGNISKWEMDSLNYYYHEHELAHVDKSKYEIVDFFALPESPEVVVKKIYDPTTNTWEETEGTKPRYVLRKICGTVIAKDKNHNTVSLLTENGVVTVRFYKGQFGFYDREISKINSDGSKTKIEKSWFKRGTKLLITGFRSGEQFIPKKYYDSLYNHTVQLITEVKENGDLALQSERADSSDEGTK